VSQKTGVLVLHGFAGYATTVDPLARSLEEHGYAVAQPTMRGHGGRPQDLDGVRYTDWIEDARKAYSELANRVDRVVIAGLSMGGLVTLYMASENPEKLAGIGETLGLSREAIRQIEAKAIAKIQHPMVLRKVQRHGRG
jgi:carboxylesterase